MRRPRKIGWFFAAPAVLLFLIFMLYPILYNLIKGFTGGKSLLSTYRLLFSEPGFSSSIANTLRWVVISGAAEIVVGFGLAMLIEFYVIRGRNIYRTILFLPMVITPTVIALVYTTLYAPDYGGLYGLFTAVGLGNHFPSLLSDPSTVTYALIGINIWQWLGWFVLLYSVAIAQIDRSLIDAAAIDGASGRRLVTRLVIPMVKPMTYTLLIFAIVQALQQFAIVYITTDGGPGYSSEVMGSYIYKLAFVDNLVPQSSALATLLFGLSFLLVGGAFVLSRGRFTIASGASS